MTGLVWLNDRTVGQGSTVINVHKLSILCYIFLSLIIMFTSLLGKKAVAYEYFVLLTLNWWSVRQSDITTKQIYE